jgi:small ligand-binding sensory domain FIST
MTQCAAALSLHPDPRHAVGEVLGELLERSTIEPTVAVVFVTDHHTHALGDICEAIRNVIKPHTLMGCTAVSIVGPGHEAEQVPALSVWIGHLDGRAWPVRLEAQRVTDGVIVSALDDYVAEHASTLLVVADPFSFPVDGWLDSMAAQYPHLRVVGGLASAARSPGNNRLALDDAIVGHGAVAIAIEQPLKTVVSQGCRPIGQPFTVTKAEGNVIDELGGQSALARLMTMLEEAPEQDRMLAMAGLHLGIVVNPTALDYERGDFLIRGVMGANRERQAVVVGDVVEVGTTVQFQVRDAASADDDLRELLSVTDAEGALLFTCNGRGQHLFGDPHHDVTVLSEYTGATAVAGMFCAGEFGPVGGRNALHGFTASIALF